VDSTVSRTISAAIVALVTLAALWAATVPAAHGAGYPRPKGASPLRSPLIPLFERCETDGGRTADTTHGGPLAYPACKDPEQITGTLTMGTPDANGRNANSLGYVQYTVVVGDPSNAVDDADVKLRLNITDVRLQGSLADYTGQLQLYLDTRITDMASGPAQDQPATLEDFSYKTAVQCAATADTTVGGTCDLNTTADALVPGTIREGKRTIWAQSDHTHILDGGDDWTASTEDDNLLFETQGVFVP
jgi:hypothetical protein